MTTGRLMSAYHTRASAYRKCGHPALSNGCLAFLLGYSYQSCCYSNGKSLVVPLSRPPDGVGYHD